MSGISMEPYREEMISSLRALVNIPSVKDAPLPGKPFGEAAYRALEEALALCREMGLETENFDGYAGHATYRVPGAGETIGILGHLDVVPVGGGWRHDPFGGEVEDGWIFGRGVLDDKGPAIAALYGFKALLDSGFQPKKNVRFIFGCDEESGWACMKHYASCTAMPDMAIVPDGDFPVIHAEKGILHLALTARFANGNVEIQAGSRANVVPDRAKARINGEEMETKGKTAHGSLPHEGVNAAAKLVDELKDRPDTGDAAPFIRFLAEKIGSETDGRSLGVAFRDEVSGALTLNLGILEADETQAKAVVDIRYPVTMPMEDLLAKIRRAAAPYGVEVSVLNHQEPLYLEKDHPLIRGLMDVFCEQTGETGLAPLAIGGGTYARALKNAAAFGPGWRDQAACEHGPDERIRVDWLVTCARLYAEAIRRLTGE